MEPVCRIQWKLYPWNIHNIPPLSPSFSHPTFIFSNTVNEMLKAVQTEMNLWSLPQVFSCIALKHSTKPLKNPAWFDFFSPPSVIPCWIAKGRPNLVAGQALATVLQLHCHHFQEFQKLPYHTSLRFRRNPSE